MRATKPIRFSKRIVVDPALAERFGRSPSGRPPHSSRTDRHRPSGQRPGRRIDCCHQSFTSALARQSLRPLQPAERPRPSKSPCLRGADVDEVRPRRGRTGVDPGSQICRNSALAADGMLRAPLGNQGSPHSNRLRRGTQPPSPHTPGWLGNRRQQGLACLSTKQIHGGGRSILTSESTLQTRTILPTPGKRKVGHQRKSQAAATGQQRANNDCFLLLVFV